MIEPEPETNIGEHGATLNVQINPEGSETLYEIRLECDAQNMSELTGCNPELGGQQWLAGDLRGGYENETVSVTLADLEPGYVYMYVIFATNAAGGTKRGANILETYPPGAYPNGSPGEEYKPEVSKGSLEYAQQEAQRLTAKAEAERRQTKELEEQKKAAEAAVRYRTEEAELKQVEEREATEAVALQAAEHPACIVPALRGDTLIAARRALVKAHCRLGKILRPAHQHSALRVTRQSARHGVKLAGGAAVAVTLAMTDKARSM